MCLKNIYKDNFLEQKKNQAIDYPLNITLNFYYCVFENISILNQLNKNFNVALGPQFADPCTIASMSTELEWKFELKQKEKKKKDLEKSSTKTCQLKF